jgi:hypothetical protein
MATIIAVDKSGDRPVKVQYDIGQGFKRFSTEEFQQVLLDDVVEDLHFGSRAYEWTDDTYDPTLHLNPIIESVGMELKSAVNARDFKKAADLKKELYVHQKHHNVLRLNNNKLMAAIAREDFEEAERLSKVVDCLKEKGPDFPCEQAGLTGSDVAVPREKPGMGEILQKAGWRALGGGLAGAFAMVTQVTTLMWMRTIMNYQYRNGGTTSEAIKILWAEGGWKRFYRGIGPALIQGPMSRFGDVAANAGMLAVLDNTESGVGLPIAFKTFLASNAAAAWRIFMMPVDTVKTTMQVEGSKGMSMLWAKSRANGPLVFYHGGVGAYMATLAGHYPWFYTHNYLSSVVPVPQDRLSKLARYGAIGFCSGVISDCVSNSLRVLKTYRQTSQVKISYAEAAQNVIAKDGVLGLFGRGLKTRIIANGMQSVMFSITWKYLEEKFTKGIA